MTSSTSSAEPAELYLYSDSGRRINAELSAEASRLASVLAHFSATCTEYPVPVGDIPGHITSYSSQADSVDVWVRQVGLGFEAADRTALLQQRYGDAGAAGPARPSLMPAWLLAFLGSGLSKQWDVIDDGYEAFEGIWRSAGFVGGLTVRSGDSYPGEVIISGSSDLKEAAGWSGNLTHMEWDPEGLQDLSGQSGWSAFGEGLDPSDLGGQAAQVVGVLVTAHEDVDRYRGQGASKVAIATGIDATLNIVCGAVGAGIGATAGAALGGFIGGPVGFAVGGTLGGAVGGIAGGMAAKWLESQPLAGAAGAGAGAILGGVIGAVGGPVGLAAGVALGGMVGGKIGDMVAGWTGETQPWDSQLADTLDRAAPAPVHAVLTDVGNLEIAGNDDASAGLSAAGQWIGSAAESVYGTAASEASRVEQALVPAVAPLTNLFQPAL